MNAELGKTDKATILVVDDTIANLTLLDTMLCRAGYCVQACAERGGGAEHR